MEKRLILGDVHGHFGTVKCIYEEELPDKIIILGDYVDSFTITPEDCTECLHNVLSLKERHESFKGKGSFIMLIGNHECHYIVPGERYSGYKYKTQELIYEPLKKAILSHKIQPIYIDDINKTIYSHAGISKVWMRNNNITNLEDINKVDFIEDLSKFKFVGLSMYGNSPESGPLWIRPSALLENKIDGWNQVVGHTHLKHPVKEDGVTFLDTLPNWYMIEYLDDNNKAVESKFVESKIAL